MRVFRRARRIASSKPFTRTVEKKTIPRKNSPWNEIDKKAYHTQLLQDYTFFDGDRAQHMAFAIADMKNRPRFMLSYSYGTNPASGKKMIIIHVMQRDYSGIRRILARRLSRDAGGGELFVPAWVRKWETREVAKWREKIGVHPQEVLMLEFLRHVRNSIHQGYDVGLVNSERNNHNRTAIIERFFKRNPHSKSIPYILSMDKRRVKEALS